MMLKCYCDTANCLVIKRNVVRGVFRCSKLSKVEDEELVLCCVRAVPVECSVEVLMTAQGRMVSPDYPGAVSMFSAVSLPSVSKKTAEMSGFCAHEKVNMFSSLLLLYR